MEGNCSYRSTVRHACHQNACSYCQMLKCGWYWGTITKEEACKILAMEKDDAYLVRDSYDSRHILSLSFRYVGRYRHSRFENSKGLYSLDNKTFVQPNQILEHCRTVLTPKIRPINRFEKLDSLQMICRFVIRQTVSRNAWDKLPLPPNLISYVSMGSDYFCTF